MFGFKLQATGAIKNPGEGYILKGLNNDDLYSSPFP